MALVVGGVEVPCSAKVVDWREHGLVFPPENAPKRRPWQKVTQFVLHWTAGDGTYKGCYRVLRSRGLSIHFYCAHDGTIYQYADPIDTWCYHAGSPTNGRSAGIEIAGPGDAPPNPRSRYETGRQRRLETIHGRTAKRALFFPEQEKAVLALCNALSVALNIPKQIPREADGSLVARLMSRRERDPFKGFLAHYMISRHKRDPGLHMMETLIADGY